MHHEENEASYAVWLSCYKFFSVFPVRVSDLCLIIATLCLQEWFVQVAKSESAHTRISIMNTAHPRNVATQSTPPPSPLNQQEAPPTVDRTVELLATPPADNTSVPESTMIHRYPSSMRKPPDIELSSTIFKGRGM